jgi:hypothetical protein
VLCVTCPHVKRDPGVDRVAAAQNQVHVPALGPPLSGRSRSGRWGRHGAILGRFTQGRHRRFRMEGRLSGNGPSIRSLPVRDLHTSVAIRPVPVGRDFLID